MRLTRFPFTVIAVLFFAALPAASQSFDIVPVADGVYGAIGRPGVYSNAAVIVNRDDVLVVDTHLRPPGPRT